MENRAMGDGVVFFLRGGRLNWNRPRPFVVRPSFCRIPRLIQLKETGIARLGVFFCYVSLLLFFRCLAIGLGYLSDFSFRLFLLLFALFLFQVYQSDRQSYQSKRRTERRVNWTERDEGKRQEKALVYFLFRLFFSLQLLPATFLVQLAEESAKFAVPPSRRQSPTSIVELPESRQQQQQQH